MTWLAAALALAALVWAGRRRRLSGQWRPAAAVIAVAMLTGAAFAGVRSQWLACALLLAAGLTVAVTAKR